MRKVISGVVGAASSVTSIQVANLLRLFKIPQVRLPAAPLIVRSVRKILCQTLSGRLE